MDLWIEYLLRFSHLVAGIAWIGSSFYFIWLDSAFEPPTTPQKNLEGEVFMVHGGFYYRVEKRKIFPGELPKTLHWFKWEATLTWITGFLLLIDVYFLRGASLLIDPQALQLSQGGAIALSLGIVTAAWFLYDFIWNPRFAAHKRISAVVSIAAFAGLVYGLTRIFSGRGAFILTGAVLGSSMLLNVWVRILPGQAKMLKDAQEGRIPDYSVSAKSKTRSVHNTYFIFPVLFIMLSNHYPSIYNSPINWLLLLILSVSGALTRHAMVTKNTTERWTLAPAAVGLLALVYLTAMPAAPGAPPPLVIDATGPQVQFTEVHAILEKRCWTCHSSHPTDDVFKAPPKDTVLETEAQFRAKAPLVQLHVVQARSMPLVNKTQMTDDERVVIGRWLKQQKLVP